MRRPPASRPARARGAVLVELALVMPVLLFLLLATVEFAHALASYQGVLKQVRAAARYLSMRAPGAGHVQAECLLRTGRISASLPCTGSAVLAALGEAQVRVTVQDALNAAATHRAQHASVDGSSQGVTVNLVTVSVSGVRHRLSFAGLLAPATGGAAVLSFGTIGITLRQAS